MRYAICFDWDVSMTAIPDPNVSMLGAVSEGGPLATGSGASVGGAAARLVFVRAGAGVHVRGFERGPVVVRERVTIGRAVDCDITVTSAEGSVLGGRRSYVVELAAPGAWAILHTGHIGTFRVNGATHDGGKVMLAGADRIELVHCDESRGVALVFDFVVAS
jgi:hypothetical protein